MESNLKQCEWAQPSGLSVALLSKDQVELFVADSESSCVRAIDMKSFLSSRTLVGGEKTA